MSFEYRRFFVVCAMRLALVCFDRPVWRGHDGALNVVRTDEAKDHRRNPPAGEFADQANPDIPTAFSPMAVMPTATAGLNAPPE